MRVQQRGGTDHSDFSEPAPVYTGLVRKAQMEILADRRVEMWSFGPKTRHTSKRRWSAVRALIFALLLGGVVVAPTGAQAPPPQTQPGLAEVAALLETRWKPGGNLVETSSHASKSAAPMIVMWR